EIALLHNNLGNSYYKNNQWDNAIENYENALKHGLDDAKSVQINITNSYNNLGEIYYNKKMCDNAIEYYEQALEGFFKKRV
ncbi:TPR Domain containing protein, partial [Reticulomyxa filosa]